MRKLLPILLLLTLLLGACSRQPAPTVYNVEYAGMTFTLDTENNTITQGEDVYRLTFSGFGNSRETVITYPNGATYRWTETAGGGHGGWSEDYDPERYVSGDVLLGALEQDRPGTDQSRSGNPLLGILFLIIGALELIFPQLGWYLKHGWAIKDAEPSDLALGVARTLGVVLVIAGIVLIVI